MASSNGPIVLTAVEVLCRFFGYGHAQATSILAAYGLNESAIVDASDKGPEAVTKLIDEAADKKAAAEKAAEIKIGSDAAEGLSKRSMRQGQSDREADDSPPVSGPSEPAPGPSAVPRNPVTIVTHTSPSF